MSRGHDFRRLGDTVSQRGRTPDRQGCDDSIGRDAGEQRGSDSDKHLRVSVLVVRHPARLERYLDETSASLRRAGNEAVGAERAASWRTFAKHVPGDSYRVQMQSDATAGTRITVTFTASPD